MGFQNYWQGDLVGPVGQVDSLASLQVGREV